MLNTKFLSHFNIKSLTERGWFAGYASVFGVVDGDRDEVMPGAFQRFLASGQEVKLLWQHEQGRPVGRITSLREDGRGLYLEGKLLLDTQAGQEAYSMLKEGVVEGLSIGYRVVDARINPESGVRELLEVELIEISLVTFPCNAEARVLEVKHRSDGALAQQEEASYPQLSHALERSAIILMQDVVQKSARFHKNAKKLCDSSTVGSVSIRDYEYWLRKELGLSRNEAKRVVSDGGYF